MLGVNMLINNYRSIVWVLILLVFKDMGFYKYLYVNIYIVIRLYLIISSYIVKVIDKNFVIKLCEYFFIFIFWKIDIIVGCIGGK